MNDTIAQNVIQSERQYVEFFDENDEYKERVASLIARNECRLIININDLRRENPTRSASVIDDSFNEIFAAQKALKRVVQNANPEFAKSHEDFYVGFEGSFGSKHVTPRTLASHLLGKMVCVEGIITKCSLVHPKIVRSVHFCPATKKTIERTYTDMTSADAFPSSGVYPTKDDEGNLLETEFGLSVYKDHQSVTVQEMPETAPAGQLPRSVDVIVDNDLVDKCKPGDRVQIVGQFRCMPGKRNGYTSASFRSVIIANNVRQLVKESGPVFSEKDIGMMRVISRRADIVSLLSRSLAPSIHGHDQVKQAILYQLLGGVERSLPNGSRIRGDINLLLMGDPSVAKSQFLRFVLQVAPRAITTTGRGSSGVGLTAAVTTDQESGERQLEAGAMVLADRGIVCIDEFDKMSDIDRTSIHEVMEQGRVTIAKAGIQAKLNARCSVLGAANPVYGRYDQYKTPMENIGLQDSLLSRFDLLFVLLDTAEPENDKAIAEHVLRAHRYRGPGEQEGEALPLQNQQRLLSTAGNLNDASNGLMPGETEEDQEASGSQDDQIFEQHATMLLTQDRTGSRGGKSKREIFTMKFLQKYIHVARQLKPRLTPEAATILAEKYCDLREHDGHEQGPSGAVMRRTQPITARTLETLIRLATANAKARMSKTVTKKDAESASELISYVMFKEVLMKGSKRKRPEADEDETEEAESENSGDEDQRRKVKSGEVRRLTQRATDLDDNASQTVGASSADPFAFTPENELAALGDGSRSKRLKKLDSTKALNISKLVSKLFQEQNTESLSKSQVVEYVREKGKFSKAEVESGLDSMMDSNKVMVTEDDVYLI